MINDIIKNTQFIIIIEYLIIIIVFYKLLILNSLLFSWCEHSEHKVREFRTFSVELVNFGANIMNFVLFYTFV